MRTAFINQLIIEARKNKNIFLIVGDLGFSVVEPFAQEFPERFLNAGIAEQNMAGIAAGLAIEGYNVFIYSIGNFPTLRCMEQIRYDICYHNLNVKIVAVGGGFSYGYLGASHHATEELGMLRIIPNLSVLSPGDPIEATILTSQLCNYAGPAYIRLGKAGEKKVHNNSLTINWSDLICLKKGINTCIVCSGSILDYCNRFINDNNKQWGLYSMPFIKPINDNMLIEIFSVYSTIISVEEHQLSGGIGIALLEKSNFLKQIGQINKMPDFKFVGIDNIFYSKAGSQDYIRTSLGITLDKLLYLE